MTNAAGFIVICGIVNAALTLPAGLYHLIMAVNGAYMKYDKALI